MKSAKILVSLFVFSTQTSAQEAPPEFDPKGAVLCSYSIHSGLAAIAKKCRSDQKDLLAIFDYSIKKHRSFVARNSELSEAELDAFETEHSGIANATCQELGENQLLTWLDMINSDLDALRTEIDQTLAVDRKPVWNPCL